MMKINQSDVLKMHRAVIKETGGFSGVRDFNLLDLAISAPFQTFNGVDLYQTIEEKCARLAYELIKNHAFCDGNKRIGVLAMLTYLELNGIELDCSDENLVDLGCGVASGKLEYNNIVTFINRHKKRELEQYK